MTDRAVRSLEFLERSASTARVLNLFQIAKLHRHTAAWRQQPMFVTPGLNEALLIKHRLRRNETDLFRGQRRVATKIVVPIDNRELKSGGRYVFFDQINHLPILKEVFGITPDHPDFRTLELMDRLPSLDPFLLREQLSRAGIDPAPCYFAISEADMQKMLTFVKSEIEPLVQLSLGQTKASNSSIERMAASTLARLSAVPSCASSACRNSRALARASGFWWMSSSMPLSRAIRSRISYIARNFQVVSTWSRGKGGLEG
jgi:hypothetical protein